MDKRRVFNWDYYIDNDTEQIVCYDTIIGYNLISALKFNLYFDMMECFCPNYFSV